MFHKCEVEENFLQMASDLPIVSDTVSYVKSTYSDFKGKSRFIGFFIHGVERSVSMSVTTAFHFSKIIIPYKFLDKIASGELKKAEEKFPIIKKPTKEIWKETLSKISGVTETKKGKEKIPDTLCSAVTTRISSVVKHIGNAVSETGPGKVLVKIGHKALDKAEEIIETLTAAKKDKPKTKPESLSERIEEIISRTKERLHEAIKKIEELKGKKKPKEQKDITLSQWIEATEHLISNYYNKLRSLPRCEKIWERIEHFVKVVLIGSLLSTLGCLHATLPALENFLKHLKEKSKKAIERGEDKGIEVYKEVQHFVCHLVDMIKGIHIWKIPVSIKHSLEIFWREITTEELTIKISMISGSITMGVESKLDAEDPNREYENSTDLPSVHLEESISFESLEEDLTLEDSFQSSDNLHSPASPSSKLHKQSSRSTLISEGSEKDVSKAFWRRFKF